MATKYELKNAWVPFDVSKDLDSQTPPSNITTYDFIPRVGEESQKRWDEATELAADGWDLVGVLPSIAGHGRKIGQAGVGFSYTCGYFLIFKRPIEE